MDLPAEIMELITPQIMENINKEGVGSKDIFFLLSDQDLKDLGFNMGAKRVILKIIKEAQEIRPFHVMDFQAPDIRQIAEVPEQTVVIDIQPAPPAAVSNQPQVSKLFICVYLHALILALKI